MWTMMCKSTTMRQGRASQHTVVRMSMGRATRTPTSRTNQQPFMSLRIYGIMIGLCIRIVHRFIIRSSLIILRMNMMPLTPMFREWTSQTRTSQTPWIIPNTVVIRKSSCTVKSFALRIILFPKFFPWIIIYPDVILSLYLIFKIWFDTNDNFFFFWTTNKRIFLEFFSYNKCLSTKWRKHVFFFAWYFPLFHFTLHVSVMWLYLLLSFTYKINIRWRIIRK